MPRFQVTVTISVDSDDETDAYLCVENAMDDLFRTDILDVDIREVAEIHEETA